MIVVVDLRDAKSVSKAIADARKRGRAVYVLVPRFTTSGSWKANRVQEQRPGLDALGKTQLVERFDGAAVVPSHTVNPAFDLVRFRSQHAQFVAKPPFRRRSIAQWRAAVTPSSSRPGLAQVLINNEPRSHRRQTQRGDPQRTALGSPQHGLLNGSIGRLGDMQTVPLARTMPAELGCSLMTERSERIAGGMWGLLIGDAVGVPYEFHALTSYRTRR